MEVSWTKLLSVTVSLSLPPVVARALEEGLRVILVEVVEIQAAAAKGPTPVTCCHSTAAVWVSLEFWSEITKSKVQTAPTAQVREAVGATLVEGALFTPRTVSFQLPS